MRIRIALFVGLAACTGGDDTEPDEGADDDASSVETSGGPTSGVDSATDASADAGSSGGDDSPGLECPADHTNSCHPVSEFGECWDYYGPTIAGQGECETDDNIWDTTLCDSTGSNGGCRHITGVDSCAVRWDFDPDSSPEQVMMECASLQGEYVPA